MMNMSDYYDFSGQKFGYPLSLSINSFDRHIFSRQKSLELSYVLQGEYQIVTEKFTSKLSKGEHFVLLAQPYVFFRFLSLHYIIFNFFSLLA